MSEVQFFDFIDEVNKVNPKTPLKSIYQLESFIEACETYQKFETANRMREWKDLFFKNIESEWSAEPFSPTSCDFDEDGWVHEDELPFEYQVGSIAWYACPKCNNNIDSPQHFYGCGESGKV